MNRGLSKVWYGPEPNQPNEPCFKWCHQGQKWPHTVENGPATVENGKNIMLKNSKQGGDDRHSLNTFCITDTNHTPYQFRTSTLKNPPKPKGSQRGLPISHSEASHILTARPMVLCGLTARPCIYTICVTQTIHTRSLVNPSSRVRNHHAVVTPSEWC